MYQDAIEELEAELVERRAWMRDYREGGYLASPHDAAYDVRRSRVAFLMGLLPALRWAGSGI